MSTIITFDLDAQPDNYKIFNSKEEWDAYPFSSAGYDRAYHDHNYGKGNTAYGGPLVKTSIEPISFPCIMFEGQYRHCSMGPDLMENFFLYQFTIVKSPDQQNE